jgi:integrase
MSAGHTFRHSYATLLKGHGEDLKTVEKSLGRGAFQVTMDVYMQDPLACPSLSTNQSRCPNHRREA